MSGLIGRARDFIVRRKRKLGAVAILLIALELAAAATLAVLGREWLEGGPAQEDAAPPALGFNGSVLTPSITVF
jgi:hypothetical protein